MSFVQDALHTVFAGESLDRETAQQCMVLCLHRSLGEASESTFGALFSAIMSRGGPAVEETLGFLDVVLWHDRDHRYVPDVEGTFGIVGSGKDDFRTFNISTGAALTAAACGVPVVKNGSRSESGVAGTTDVMEALGVEIDPTEAAIDRSLQSAGLTFVDAGENFPLMGDVYVGKFLFINPLSYVLSIASSVEFDNILFGLAAEEVEFTAEILAELGMEGSTVVAGRDGDRSGFIDECSVSGPSDVARVTDAGVETRTIQPGDVGVQRHDVTAIAEGESTAENVEILLRAIAGPDAEPGHAPTDAVALNAAPVLVGGGVARDLEEAVDVAYDAIVSGDVYDTLARLVETSGGDPTTFQRSVERAEL